eukprot:m.254826 g.254826  ORF g.254826 m.254826 type:complete len:524 (+) comp26732_c0_seq31:2449-4020(+)
MFSYLIKRNENCPCDSGMMRKLCCYKYTGEHRANCLHATNPEEDPAGVECAKWSDMIFPCVSLLQQVSNHLGLLLPDTRASAEKKEKAMAIARQAFGRHSHYFEGDNRFIRLSAPEVCGKLKVLGRLLSIHGTTSKILLFSYSLKLLDLIETNLQSKGFDYLRLDGQTPAKERFRMVTRFNENPNLNLFLISTRAGGVGLNLTSANVVVIFDPNWNPAHDLQAQDRAFRIGQTRDVTVYRLIAAGSLEELVYARQIYKQQLANMAQTASNERRLFDATNQPQSEDENNPSELFGLDLLLSLLPDGSFTEKIIERNEHAELGFLVSQYQGANDLPVSSPSDTDDADEHSLKDIVKELQTYKDDKAPVNLNDIVANGHKLLKRRTSSMSNRSLEGTLEDVGVTYVHDNRTLIGSSKVEDIIASRRGGVKAKRRSSLVHAAQQLEQKQKGRTSNLTDQVLPLRDAEKGVIAPEDVDQFVQDFKELAEMLEIEPQQLCTYIQQQKDDLDSLQQLLKAFYTAKNVECI